MTSIILLAFAATTIQLIRSNRAKESLISAASSAQPPLSLCFRRRVLFSALAQAIQSAKEARQNAQNLKDSG